VIALLHRALPSMVHIESLLLLARLAPEPSSRYAIAAEVRSSPALVAAALADLETARLVASVPATDPPEHRFAPADAADVASVAALRDVYERKPVTLIRAMYERPAPPSAAQAFADAFRVRPPGER
jgi:hypothetical protein